MLVDKLRNAWARLTGRAIIPPGAVIGDRVHIGEGVRLDWSHGHHITIEDDVTLVSGARILTHDASSHRRTGLTWVAPVTLKRGCFIGAGALILPGVTVGEEAIVAAGAVVTSSVDAGAVVAGVPARQLTTTAELDARRRQEAQRLSVFPESVYNRHPLPADVTAELRAAAGPRGYFLARIPGATSRGTASATAAVPVSQRTPHGPEE